MTNREKKELEEELQELVIKFDSLYARCLIGVSQRSAHLDNDAFDALAVPDTIVLISDTSDQYSGNTKNGLRITTIRDTEEEADA